MNEQTINTIQQAKDNNLIVQFVDSEKESAKTASKSQGQIIALWVSCYNKQLIDALVDIYPPQELIFKEIDKKCQGCFLFVNTATESLLCMYLGQHNRLQLLHMDPKLKFIERDSREWKKFTKIDRKKALGNFADHLEKFGMYARRWDQLPSNDEVLTFMLEDNPNTNSFTFFGEVYSREGVEELIKDLETLQFLGTKSLDELRRFFPNIDWGELNMQDAW